jgi:ppGpp synthetase/RelA/SpoT-type nucleotidyltranferase
MDFETYCQLKHFEYAALAEIIALILKAALAEHPHKFRIQQVQARAKSTESLKKKLEDRGLVDTTTLEADIKDLAGCRLIFYSNSDVSRFMQTGIISDNFDIDWDRTKIHYPVPGKSDPNDLFISNNYVVGLRPERTKLPEYSRFTGLACEVQVQTTLNHAWSEMEHDILYKKPKFTGFGGKLFEAIEQRFQRIMRTHLLPAGYEFQKALDDYERLVSGKQLFDNGALKALANCENNDARINLLERFRDYVLPNYDDPVGAYPEIKESIVAAIKDARQTIPQMIKTPIGSFPGATAEPVVQIGCEILSHLRYVSIDLTFDAICELYPEAQNDGERKHLMTLSEHLAQHNLDVWKQVGPFVQAELVRRVHYISEDKRVRLMPIMLSMLGEALGTEAHGMTNTYNAVSLHRGPVVAGDTLATLRSQALDILMNFYRAASSDNERMQIKNTMFAATKTPTSSSYEKELLASVLNDSARVVDFFSEYASINSYEIIQNVEERILWMHRRTMGIQAQEKDVAVLTATNMLSVSIKSFRGVVAANKGFVIYKTLVGYNSVFPPMWEDEDFDFEKAAAYRQKKIDEFVAQIEATNSEEWFAIIHRCAQTRSNDLATFPSFGEFFQKIGRTKPSILLGYIDRLDDRLAGFLGVMLSGLAESDQAGQMQDKIAKWLSEDRYLVQIAHYFRFTHELDSCTLQKVILAGIRLKNDDVVAQVLATTFGRYKDGTSELIAKIILPGIEYFTEKRDAQWVNLAWFISKEESFLSDVSDQQVEVLLKNLIHQPRIETHTEFVLAILASKRAARIFDFCDERLSFAASRDGQDSYEAVPYEFYELQSRFSDIANHAVEVVRRRFVIGDSLFQLTGGRLISAAFPKFSEPLKNKLMSCIQTGGVGDLEFVAKILASYDGEPFVEEPCKEIVRKLPAGNDLWESIEIVLQSIGVVSGEFGLVEAYRQKREAISSWLSDRDESVRLFSQKFIGSLDRQIAAEQRRSEEYLELRKRSFDDHTDKKEE